jgi:hypothetical protein
MTMFPWRVFSHAERDSVEVEAHNLPLPGPASEIVVRWND